LSDSRGAKADYNLLTGTLDNLCQTFEAIQQIHLDPQEDLRQQITLDQAVARCRGSIEAFLERTAKYSALKSTNSSKDWKLKLQTGIFKVKWSTLKKGAVDKFQKDLWTQVQAINFLLSTLQLYDLPRAMIEFIKLTSSLDLEITVKRPLLGLNAAKLKSATMLSWPGKPKSSAHKRPF
jgi:hypothetical protein